MTGEELSKLVADVQQRQAELSDVEVKSAHRGTPRRLYEPLSALANRSGGGVILFGLDESRDFRVVGVGNVQGLQQDVSSLASEMEPVVRPEFTVARIKDKTVVAAEIPEAGFQQKPCYYRTAGLSAGAYIRVGNTNRRMTDYEVFGYVSARTQPDFDQHAVSDATLDDLDLERVESYVEQLRKTRPGAEHLRGSMEEVLRQLRLAQEADGVVRPTLAGLLMFGKYPQSFEPQLVITFTQYYGTDEREKAPRGERFLDNQKFEGPIPEMIDEAVKHIMATMRKSSLVEGLYRRDIPEYPEEVVREAIVNAVAHRDYSQFVRGSQVQVKMFADRLKVISPGGLYGNVTEDNLENAESTRNRFLMRAMEDLRIAENRGSGVDAMIAAMRQANLEPPRFRDRRAQFEVTFRSHTLMGPEAVEWLNQFATRPLNDRQRLALVYLRHNPRMANSDYQRLNQVDSVMATRHLHRLLELDLIEQHGTRGGAYYTLAVHVEVEVVRPPETDEAKIIAYVREHESIGNAECRALLGGGPSRAYYLLGRLCKAGVLKPKGERKWRRYVLS